MFKRILASILCSCTLAASLVSCNFFNTHNDSGTESKDNNEISCEKALETAKEYWKSYCVEENGYIIVEAVSSYAPENVYVFVLKHLVKTENSSHYSTIDEIWVDRTTGEAIVPYDAKPGLMFDYGEVLQCLQIRGELL